MADFTAGPCIVREIGQAWETARGSWNDSYATSFHDNCIFELIAAVEKMDKRAREMGQACESAQQRVHAILG